MIDGRQRERNIGVHNAAEDFALFDYRRPLSEDHGLDRIARDWPDENGEAPRVGARCFALRQGSYDPDLALVGPLVGLRTQIGYRDGRPGECGD